MSRCDRTIICALPDIEVEASGSIGLNKLVVSNSRGNVLVVGLSLSRHSGLGHDVPSESLTAL